MTRTISAPDGSVWTVRRRWTKRPRWRSVWSDWRRRQQESSATRRQRRGSGDRVRWYDGIDVFDVFGDGPGIIHAIIGVVLLAIFMIFVGVPLILFLAEAFFISLPILLAGIVTRVLFRRPWILEATTAGQVRRWSVVGWRASTRALHQMERDLAAGYELGHSPRARAIDI